MRRVKNTGPSTRLLVEANAKSDNWLRVDDGVLEEIRRRLPCRMRRGWKLRNLDCRGLDLHNGLPEGIRCDEINLAHTRVRTLPDDFCVSQSLDLQGCDRLRSLPAGLRVGRLNLSGCTALTQLPDRLHIGHLSLEMCRGLTRLPPDLCCFEITAQGSGLRSIPAGVRVQHLLDLSDCRRLQKLPAGLRVRRLLLNGCERLEMLPPHLEAFDLNATGCTSLSTWCGPVKGLHGRLQLAGCARLRALPEGLEQLEFLDVRDCSRLTSLPEGLRVWEWVDVAGSGLTDLPASLRGARLLWRGVSIDERIAFHPEQLTPDEILHERNAERRRVMLERYGLERLLSAGKAELLDSDTDAGGRRQLLRLEVRDGEPLVCVAVQCPSTGRRYVLRVPPTTQSCRQAVAWTAGFEDPSDYRPLVET
jgi:hypothetical protein